MKYLITESKLEQVIYDYIDKLFAAENGKTEIHKLNSLGEDDDEIDDAYDFVNDESDKPPAINLASQPDAVSITSIIAL